MQEEILSLKLRVSEQEEVLKGTIQRLRSTSRTKESMEHFIVNQCECLPRVWVCERGERSWVRLKTLPLWSFTTCKRAVWRWKWIGSCGLIASKQLSQSQYSSINYIVRIIDHPGSHIVVCFNKLIQQRGVRESVREYKCREGSVEEKRWIRREWWKWERVSLFGSAGKLKVGALREAINQVNNGPLQIAHKNTGLLLSSSKCKTEGKCVVVTALLCLLM